MTTRQQLVTSGQEASSDSGRNPLLEEKQKY